MQMDLLKIEFVPLTVDEAALNERAIQIAKVYTEAETSLLEVIDEVERSKLYLKLNCAYITTYCIKILNLSPSTAALHVTVVHRSQQVPALREAIVRGELSVPTGVQVCSVITNENADHWIGKATTLTKSELEKEVRTVSPRAKRREQIKRVDEETSELTIHLSNEDREKLERARELESQRRAQMVTLSETVAAALEIYLEKKDPVRKAARSKARPSEPNSTYRNGRRTAIPAAVSHAVHRRDRGKCRAINAHGKECGSGQFTHQHHVVAVEDGGQHTVENLITVCSYHHRMLHRPFPGIVQPRA